MTDRIIVMRIKRNKWKDLSKRGTLSSLLDSPSITITEYESFYGNGVTKYTVTFLFRKDKYRLSYVYDIDNDDVTILEYPYCIEKCSKE